MDQGKVTAVAEWPTPQTIKELQRFLGFANFYRRFIKGFSLLTAPLTTLLRGKPKSLSWNPNAHDAFDSLKTAFSTAPILRHPDPQVPFVVEVDASTTGAGAVLSQLFGEPPRLQPCAYYSKKLTPAEQNYDWEQGATNHQACARGVAALAGGSKPPVHCHHRSQEPPIPPTSEEAQPQASLPTWKPKL